MSGSGPRDGGGLPDAGGGGNGGGETGRTPGADRASTDDVAALRRAIEEVDREILDAVARRIRLARQIGAVKRDAAAATLDPGREAAVIRRAVENGRRLDLPPEPVRELFWTLVGMCRSSQMEDR